MASNAVTTDEFLSTPSARRATNAAAISVTPFNDFYPRPPRGGRRHGNRGNLQRRRISIHALREEGDPVFANLGEQAILFLSTPSARRATQVPNLSQAWMKISIHALREEGDSPSLPSVTTR